MPITSDTEPSRNLTTLTATDKITFEDIIEVVKTFKDSPPAKNIVWDFSSANPVDPFNAMDMDRIAVLAKTNLNFREQPDGKTAFVATSDFIFGLARMYTTYLELQGPAHEIQVFRSLDEAHEWLAE